LIKNTPILAVY